MGLLDGILGNVLGSLVGGANNNAGTGAGAGGQNQQSMLLTLVLQLIQQSGGLGAILGRLKEAGLTKQADSWVSTGSNLPVSGEQISQALGPDLLSQLQAGTGMDSNQLGNTLAQLLPNVVDQLTPEGEIPSNHDQLISDGLAALRAPSWPQP
jgi:uncharacterized protein YidB (DUF937 family)